MVVCLGQDNRIVKKQVLKNFYIPPIFFVCNLISIGSSDTILISKFAASSRMFFVYTRCVRKVSDLRLD